MDQNQANNLRILADHMAGLARQLNMNCIHSCGTPACAIGEAACLPAFQAQGLSLDQGHPNRVKMNDVQEWYAPVAFILFGLDRDRADWLFGTSVENAWRRQAVTGPEWSAKAREILAAHGYGPQSSEDWAKDKVAYVINSQDALIGTDKRDLLVTK